jgi:hypothetical protein
MSGETISYSSPALVTVEHQTRAISVATPSFANLGTMNAARWWHLSSRVVRHVDVEIQQQSSGILCDARGV